MSVRNSINLINSSGTAMNLTSMAVKGDSYYGYTDGLHTIQVQYTAFAGRVRIQASLSVDPTEDDWFSVGVPGFTAAGEDAYKEYLIGSERTGSENYTFRGNFAWIRVQLDRSEIGDGSTYDNAYGQLTRVLFAA